jgi:hypothetical protein
MKEFSGGLIQKDTTFLETADQEVSQSLPLKQKLMRLPTAPVGSPGLKRSPLGSIGPRYTIRSKTPGPR